MNRYRRFDYEPILRALLTIGGLVLSVVCGYGLYWLANTILSGAMQGNWFLVVAGGILLYLFFGLLITGVIVGFFIAIAAWSD